MPDEVKEDEPCEDPSIYFDSLTEIPVDADVSSIPVTPPESEDITTPADVTHADMLAAAHTLAYLNQHRNTSIAPDFNHQLILWAEAYQEQQPGPSSAPAPYDPVVFIQQDC